jgi:hypothetical protein
MYLFSRFLIEEDKKVKNGQVGISGLPHLEDLMFHKGHDGVHAAADALDDAHHMLSGHKGKNQYQTHYDGSPPIMFGIHPQTSQFFVSSPKGQSKVNYTPEDIINNHSGNPKLAGHLITALSELPKIMPKNSQPGHIYHGDLLHTPDSIHDHDNHHHFKANQMVYSAPTDSGHGKAAKISKLGLVVHSMYGPDGTPMPLDSKSRSKFNSHPDVHNIDPTLQAESGKYERHEMTDFLKHRDAATKHYQTMKPESLEAATVHGPDIMKHIDSQISKGKPYNAQTFLNDSHRAHDSRMSSITNEKWRKQRTSDHAAKTAHVLANSTNLDKVFKLHKHLADAKNVLTGVMDKNVPWIHSIGGQVTGAEGFSNGTVRFHNRKERTKLLKKTKK